MPAWVSFSPTASASANLARICAANGPVTGAAVTGAGAEGPASGEDGTGTAPRSGTVASGAVVPPAAGLVCWPPAVAGSAKAGRGVRTQTTVQTSTGQANGRVIDPVRLVR